MCRVGSSLRSTQPTCYLRLPNLCSWEAQLRSKQENEAATRAASFEPPVSFGRALARVGTGDAQADRSLLNQLAQAIEFLELAVVGAHERGREPDAPLGSALKPAHSSERAAVAHGRNGTLVEHGPV